MAATETVGPVDRATMERLVSEDALPGWAVAHYEGFHDDLLGNRGGTPFPCHFGTESARNGDALYALCDSTSDPGALDSLAGALAEYARVFRDHADRASLVTFFAPPDREQPAGEQPDRDPLSYDEWFDAFWGVLQALHDRDPVPWPHDVPADPADPRWEFCFAGEPIFPTVRAPCFERRRSRRTPHGLEITFQPRAIFHGVTGDTDAGQAARAAIRGRLDDYDDVPAHPDLGDWGDDLEWRQYMLPDDQSSHADCPIEVTKP